MLKLHVSDCLRWEMKQETAPVILESVSANSIRTAVAIGLGAKKIFFGGGERLDSDCIE